uniref:EOG090X0AW0 n=1 Tax=Evadne anonyx TaxID=141404 RepID=A0A9N6WSA2_9CRUS|nr:EOG090X0AW0 [Evadne anonyx]
MAASMSMLLSCHNFRHLAVQFNHVAKFSRFSKLLTNAPSQTGYTSDPGEFFFNENIQQLLGRITGRDYDKIFRSRKLGQKLEPPRYELLTEDEINALRAEYEKKADLKLKMPPLLQEREPINNILAVNPEIQGFDTSKYIFTDITFGIPDRKRKVVVRDPNGVLKEASWEEKQKMCQIFFPIPGRKIKAPKMFEQEHLQGVLARKDYEFVLDRACAQYEPDDPEYIRVSRKTYDHVNDSQAYGTLRSTRHFGPMVLHLVLSKQMDNLLSYLITIKDIAGSADLIRVFHIVEQETSPADSMTDLELIENYINKHALKKPTLELALETYKEIEKQQREIDSLSTSQLSN